VNLPSPLDRVFRRLHDYYDRLAAARGKQVKSSESGFEAQMKARMYLGRHEPLLVRAPDGSGPVVWRDEGIRCGLVYVGQGDEFPEEPRTFRVADQPHLARPDGIAAALRSADLALNHRLELIARTPMQRHLEAFGLQFKSEGGERALQRAPLLGVAQEPSRGPAPLAPLTATAQALWGTRAEDEVNRLGLQILRRGASAEDRAIARQIRAETCTLALDSLREFATLLSRVERLPFAVQRAGRAA
jgi:hypothetical protein